ncbi:hypothetical protein BLA29_011194, partial [Euroglyphus maynei]
GYFGCQVNESTDYLQLFELSKLCDGLPQCFQGSDEITLELKCNDRNQCTNCKNVDVEIPPPPFTNDIHNCQTKQSKCTNGVCLDHLCYCNDGFGGKSCDIPGK